MTQAANTDKLGALHDAIADVFLDQLSTAKKRAMLSAADIGVMVKFLKDNDITAAPVPQAKTTQIAKILPFPSGEDELAVAEG